MTLGAMAIALLAAVSCSNEETEIITGPGNGNDDQVALGITPNLKVDAGTKATTKSVVSGEAITYDVNKYGDADYAPGLGILVTNNDATGWYTPDGTEYTGHHVWYMGDEKGTGWISIKSPKGDTFKNTKEVPYYLTKTVGKVYGYYPYDAAITSSLSSISKESDLKIPVTVLAAGTIDASTNNAKKYWKENVWATTPKTDQINLSLPTEKDYLYFAGTEGRYVNNGRAAGETPVKPDADPDNTNATNPGYKINLDMKHAMAMVTFRVYDGGKLSEQDVNFTKFQIKNTATSQINPFKMGSGYMSLVDGVITPNSQTNGDISRTVNYYVLMRQIEPDGTEGEHAFIVNGSTVNAKIVCKTVSAIVYPTASFGDDDIQVIITLKEGGNADMVFPVTLPANQWEANNNYIYTFSAGRNKLTIMDVTVEAWSDNEQDEIPL